MAGQSVIMRFLRMLWHGIDRLRRILHLLFLLLIFGGLLVIFSPEPVIVPENAALVLSPRGTIVDQLSGDALDRALSELQGSAQRETLLRDLIDAVESATTDDRITAMLLDLNGFSGAGISKMQELAHAIEGFKASGKPVIASGDGYGRDQYYLAALADEIFLHPMGVVLIEGYGRFVPYYKSALESVYIDYAVWTAGEYKSFTEPYTRDEMSAEDRLASSVYLDVLWRAYTEDVTTHRGLDPAALDRLADEFSERIAMVDGDAAQLALDFGLVDALMNREQVNARLIEIVGASDSDNGYFTGISQREYLAAVRPPLGTAVFGRKVAVITLAGEIFDGIEAPGSVGGDSTAQLIRQVARDTNVRALVLRVDSPGGSAFASEVILDALEAYQATDRPLVVSMSSVAASGGYWVSMAADEIWANPTTITGSIGVGALAPIFSRALEKIGINIDGVGTNALSGQFSQLSGLGDDADAYFSSTVAHLYNEFVSKVAAARDSSFASIDSVARGRVWAGTDALEHGLVDNLGTLDDAISSAAGLGGLEPGSYEVEYIERELSLSETIALQFAQTFVPVADLLALDLPWSDRLGDFVETLIDPLEHLARYNDPRGIYSYCFCDVR